MTPLPVVPPHLMIKCPLVIIPQNAWVPTCKSRPVHLVFCFLVSTGSQQSLDHPKAASAAGIHEARHTFLRRSTTFKQVQIQILNSLTH